LIDKSVFCSKLLQENMREHYTCFQLYNNGVNKNLEGTNRDLHAKAAEGLGERRES